MLPPFIGGRGINPPPFVVARLIYDETFRECVEQTGGKKRVIQSRSLLSQRGVGICRRGDGRRYVVSEIGLQDLPENIVAHSDLIGHFFMGSIFPKSQARFIRDIVGGNKLPAELIEKIERECVEIPLEGFSVAEIDVVLVIMFLHEFAEIFWRVLPSALKEKWMSLYPIDGNSDRGYVYFRNLIRLHTEWDHGMKDRDSFFAQETFADVLGLYWAGGNLTTYHRRMFGGVVERHRGFLDEVMAWARAKFERDGSVFMI